MRSRGASRRGSLLLLPPLLRRYPQRHRVACRRSQLASPRAPYALDCDERRMSTTTHLVLETVCGGGDPRGARASRSRRALNRQAAPPGCEHRAGGRRPLVHTHAGMPDSRHASIVEMEEDREMGARFLTAAALAMLLLAAPAAAHRTPGKSAKPMFPRDCRHEARRPPNILVACGDGNNRLQSIHWGSWGRARARGVGVDFANDCTPYCAAGRFHRYPARVTLQRPRYCPALRVRQFTRLVIYFPRAKPSAERTMRVPFPCAS